MVGLGWLPGVGGESWAFATSADGAVVAGMSGLEAFRWTADGGMVGLGDLVGGSYNSRADATSADGSVVVGGGSSASGAEAFRWTEATGMVGLGDLPGGYFYSQARAVSADGSVVVGNSASGSGTQAFLWTVDDGMCSMHDLLTTHLGLDLAGWSLNSALGISDDGTVVVGEGRNPDGMSEAWIAHIPEPTTLSLLLIGGLMLRRKQ